MVESGWLVESFVLTLTSSLSSLSVLVDREYCLAHAVLVKMSKSAKGAYW